MSQITVTLLCARGASACKHACATNECYTFKNHFELLDDRNASEIFTPSRHWCYTSEGSKKRFVSDHLKEGWEAEMVPQDSELYRQVVGHLSRKYRDDWYIELGFSTYLKHHPWKCCGEMFEHVLFIKKDREWEMVSKEDGNEESEEDDDDDEDDDENEDENDDDEDWEVV